MSKPLREQSECKADDNTNSPLSDSLKKINDIAQNIKNVNFWIDVYPSKTMDKILYVSKSIGKIFLDPTIAVSLIEFACSGYTKKQIRNSVALSSIDAVRNVLMAKKFGDMIVDKINVRKLNYKPKMIDTIEDLYPNLKKIQLRYALPVFCTVLPPTVHVVTRQILLDKETNQCVHTPVRKECDNQGCGYQCIVQRHHLDWCD